MLVLVIRLVCVCPVVGALGTYTWCVLDFHTFLFFGESVRIVGCWYEVWSVERGTCSKPFSTYELSRT